MKRLFLMRNPELFQGEKYLSANKNYFEGWYFKNTNNENGISFIPGINIEGKDKKAFIQVITNETLYFVNYNINDFKFEINPFKIQIANNVFSKKGLYIDIKDESQKLKIQGEIKYSNSENINTNCFYPNIMGPFSYIPFMECNHSILSMKNRINGSININNNIINFNNDTGYIEKDWGCSFPKSYIWCQGNNFQKSNASFMLSIADIPFKLINFRGVICVIIINNQEFKFATYNNAKIIKYDITNNFLNITLKKGPYTLDLQSKYDAGMKLFAPVEGKMEKDIFESITSLINVTLKKDNTVIFSDMSKNCGLEIVQ
ncbi:MAG: hypothetical protein HFJ55_02865 [Clostridia bacterium]|nr:hypothetical protein [Clostridia bacterium]